jgi:4-diphosphocytidyl-2-C-methyl-D-erythritol kinase
MSPVHTPIHIKTPAKINVFLHITGRRADGYHLLQSVFRAVSLYDMLTLRVREDGLITRSVGPSEFAADSDLSVRAARLLQQATNCKLGCDIELHKTIPSGAGLGVA